MQSAYTHRASAARHITLLLAAVLISAGAAIQSFGAPGDLDPSFRNGGLVFTEIPRPAGFETFYPNVESMVVQPDGKIVVAGRFWEDVVSYWYGTFIVRYMPDGTLDPSFGTNGIVAVIGRAYPYGGDAIGADVALQPDGKIVLIGQKTIANGILVQRYTSSGEVDTSFGDGGSSLVKGNAFAEGISISIQPDGKIVGTGWDYDPYLEPYYDAILLFRLNEDGSPDRSFGPTRDGKLFIQHGYYGAQALIQRDGRILVAGIHHVNGEVPPTILVARYEADGSLDSSFGTDGRATYRDDDISYLSAAALQSDGKIVVADVHRGLLRFNPDGALDTSFGVNGVAPFESDFSPVAVLVQRNGRIIAVGNVPNAATNRFDFALIRMSFDGFPDRDFGTDGKAVYPINAGGTNFASAAAAALQPDGNILIAGLFGYYYTDSHETIAVARFLSPTPRGRPVRASGSGR